MGPHSRPPVSLGNAAEDAPRSREIEGAKETLAALIAGASRNSTAVREIARRLGYSDPPETSGKPVPEPVPHGHIQELQAKMAVLTIINSQTRDLLEFIESQI